LIEENDSNPTKINEKLTKIDEIRVSSNREKLVLETYNSVLENTLLTLENKLTGWNTLWKVPSYAGKYNNVLEHTLTG
jgi:hypothetical protein